MSRGFGVEIDQITSHLDQAHGKDGIIFMPTLLLPKSLGEITLRDNNPMTPPLIDPHYLEHPDDVKALVDGNFKILFLHTIMCIFSSNFYI